MTTLTETPGYIPVSDWPNLEALAVGYSEYLMPESHRLAGKHIILVFRKDATRITHHFLDPHTLTWEIMGDGSGGNDARPSGTAEYKAFEVRPDIFLVDFYKPAFEEQVSLVMNLKTGQVICGISGLHIRNDDDGQKKRTWTKFSDASIESEAHGDVPASPFAPTNDLIGKHVLYRYTPRDAYEHIYHNQGTFTWHCLSGTEKGLADTEPCKMLKLAPKLYLLFWSEKVMPVESIVVVDLDQMRSTGRFFCWDPKPAKLVRMLFGSYATVLAETDAAGMVDRSS